MKKLKAAVMDEGDVVQITQGTEKKSYIKKSGWRKIQAAYGIKTKILAKEREDINGTIFWNFQVAAYAPNGAFSENIGSCNSGERSFAHGESDIMMTAQTRATNRAISDVVGGGDVSAEELT